MKKIIKIYGLVAFILFVLFVLVSIFYPLFILGSDEAYNYLVFSRYGPIYSLTHYEVPNNHVFFTFLQSFIVRKKILVYFPYEIRLLNCIFGALFITGIYYYLNKYLKPKNLLVFLIFVVACCFFASPLITPYFIVARGYILAITVFFVGMYFLTVKKFYFAALAFILSIWTLPTYLFIMPALYIVSIVVYKQERKSIVLSGIAVILGSILAYTPILKDVINNSGANWGIKSLPDFLRLTYESISNLSYVSYGLVLNILYIGAYIFSFICIYKEKIKIEFKRYLLFSLFAMIGYIVTVSIIFACSLINAPFVRNGMFIPVVMSLTILSASYIVKNKYKRIFFMCVMLLNVVLGTVLLMRTFNFGRVTPYPVYEGEQMYRSESLKVFLADRKLHSIKYDTYNPILLWYYSFVYSVPIVE